jgi:hypothetical protein
MAPAVPSVAMNSRRVVFIAEDHIVEVPDSQECSSVGFSISRFNAAFPQHGLVA